MIGESFARQIAKYNNGLVRCAEVCLYVGVLCTHCTREWVPCAEEVLCRLCVYFSVCCVCSICANDVHMCGVCVCVCVVCVSVVCVCVCCVYVCVCVFACAGTSTLTSTRSAAGCGGTVCPY